MHFIPLNANSIISYLIIAYLTIGKYLWDDLIATDVYYRTTTGKNDTITIHLTAISNFIC